MPRDLDAPGPLVEAALDHARRGWPSTAYYDPTTDPTWTPEYGRLPTIGEAIYGRRTKVAVLGAIDRRIAQVRAEKQARLASLEAWSDVGAGRAIRPRADWGSGFHDLRCDTCEATWVGPECEPCPWCIDRQAHRQQWQPEREPVYVPGWLVCADCDAVVRADSHELAYETGVHGNLAASRQERLWRCNGRLRRVTERDVARLGGEL